MVAAASVRMPARATVTAPIRLNSSSTTPLNFTGRPRPYHCVGQCGAPQPDSISFCRHSTRPSSGFQLASSQARTSLRTEVSVASVIVVSSSRGPVLQHQFAVVARITQEDFRTFGTLEPEVGVFIPGEADATAHLDGVDRGLHVGVGA